MTGVEIAYWIAAGIADVFVVWGLGKFFFGDLDGFGEAVFFWFKPDIFSWMSGEGGADFFAELKLALFLICCGAVGYGEFLFSQRLFP